MAERVSAGLMGCFPSQQTSRNDAPRPKARRNQSGAPQFRTARRRCFPGYRGCDSLASRNDDGIRRAHDAGWLAPPCWGPDSGQVGARLYRMDATGGAAQSDHDSDSHGCHLLWRFDADRTRHAIVWTAAAGPQHWVGHASTRNATQCVGAAVLVLSARLNYRSQEGNNGQIWIDE